MDGLFGVDHVFAVSERLDGGAEIVGRVAYLEGDAGCGRQGETLAEGQGEGVEVAHPELLAVGRGGVVAVGDVEDVALDVFLDDKPRSAAETQALALTDGVEPQAAVPADELAGCQLDDVAGLFAKVAAQIVVVVDLA